MLYQKSIVKFYDKIDLLILCLLIYVVAFNYA